MIEKNFFQTMLFMLKYPALAIVGFIAIVLIFFAGLQARGNFHVVADGSLYRSAQPSIADLQRYAHDWGIQSVINLRLEESDGLEQEAASRLGVKYFHIPVAADHLWSAPEILKVMSALGDAPKPVLIHSQFGADRTGLASAMYLLMIANKSIAESSDQLSLKYGHLSYFGSPTSAMDDTFSAVANLYTQKSAAHRAAPTGNGANEP